MVGKAEDLLRQDYKFGCVFFDNQSAEAGWSCVSGEEPKRIQSVDALGTEYIWLTNLEYDSMFEHSLNQNPWLKHSGYLRLKVDQIINEWGVATVAVDRNIRWFADLFNRIMRYAAFLHPECAWREPTIADSFANLWSLPEMPDGQLAPAMRQALRETLQEWTSVYGIRNVPGNVRLKLMRPRGSHYHDMMSCSIPAGPWLPMIDHDILPPRDERPFWLLEKRKPVLCNLHIQQDYRTEHLSTFAFGAGRTDRRNWSNEKEMEYLQRMTSQPLVIDTAFIGCDYHTLFSELNGAIVNLQGIETLTSSLGMLSWSAGLVLENLWVSATKIPSMVKKKKGDADGGRNVSFRCSWLRTADRLIMFEYARRMQDCGWDVAGYGVGSVHIVINPNHIRQAITDAFRIGLIPSMQCIQGGDIMDLPDVLTPDQWGGETDVLLSSLAAIGARGESLSVLDGLIEYPAEYVGDLLQSLLVS